MKSVRFAVLSVLLLASLSVLTLANCSINANFSDPVSGADVKTLIIQYIGKAEHTIEMIVYSITSKDIADALVQATERGVKVSALIDGKGAKVEGSVVSELEKAGADIKYVNAQVPLNYNFIVIDSHLVLTGTFSLSDDVNKSYSTLVAIDSEDVSESFEAEFNVLAFEATSLAVAATTKPSAECISWEKAADYVGETVWVYGEVKSVARLSYGRVFINLGNPYPQTPRFTVMIKEDFIGTFDSKFGENFEKKLIGQVLYVYGKVSLYHGQPEIKPTSPDQLAAQILGTEIPSCAQKE